MNKLSFIVYGQSVPKQSMKIAVNKRTGRIWQYTPKKITNWHSDVRKSALPVKPVALFKGPLKATVLFFMAKPSSKPKWKIYADVKPDADNLQKAVFDALEKLIFKNDSQICIVYVVKKYDDDNPRAEITIEEIDEKGEYEAQQRK